MSKKEAKQINDPRSLWIKATLSSEVRDQWLHPCPGRWLAIGHAIVYYVRLPRHLVQELNAVTVPNMYTITDRSRPLAEDSCECFADSVLKKFRLLYQPDWAGNQMVCKTAACGFRSGFFSIMDWLTFTWEFIYFIDRASELVWMLCQRNVEERRLSNVI